MQQAKGAYNVNPDKVDLDKTQRRMQGLHA